jgi:hypothetical protein
MITEYTSAVNKPSTDWPLHNFLEMSRFLMAWRVLGLRMEEWSADMEGSWVCFEYTPRKTDEGWSFRLTAGKGGNMSSLKEKTTVREASWSAVFTKYYSRDQTKKIEMDGVYSTHGDESCIEDFGKENWWKETTGSLRLILADISNVYLQEVDIEEWNGLIWLRIGKGDGLFWIR